MFSHVHVGVGDFERALAFYRALMPVLGIAERFCEPERPWAGWQSDPGPRPLFLIGRPHDGQAHAAGHGQMVAFMAADRATVDRAHAVALAHGGRCEGAPGPRPAYHPHYYGAYFRDTEGNKLCVVCHAAPASPRAGTPGAVRIAPLTAADADRYRALMLEAYTREPDAFVSTAQERAAAPAAYWTSRIAHPAGAALAWGAFDGSALVGTVALEYSDKPKTRHKALLIGMYVDAAARRAGAGQALVEAAVAHAKARTGTLQIVLTVTDGNEPAIRLYRRLGFQPFGLEPMAIRTDTGFKAKLHMALAW